VFEYRGKRYFVYSAYMGPDSDLLIARMSNPWTLAGGETVISKPDLSWERQGGRQIDEGPEFLEGPRGQLFLTFSGSACWSDDYALGLLSAPAGSDPLDARVWTKSPEPVLQKSEKTGVYATGHNGFFTSPDGKTHWIIYHANAGPNMGCTAKRAPHIQPFSFAADGKPVFGEPVKEGVPLPAPR
jgi:GH43 family beta-xylosidase